MWDFKNDDAVQNEIGGKAKGLLLLQQTKLLTPIFYLFDFSTLQKALHTPTGLHELVSQWRSANSIANDTLWAVRSSAGQEDGATKSFAGQYTSVLNQRPEQLPEALNEVLQSYQQNTGYAESAIAFGVIIQEMIRPDFSGVFFSRDPVLAYSAEPVISMVPGLGDALVSGQLSGYNIAFKNGEPLFSDMEERIAGEQFNGHGREPVECTVAEIERAIAPHLSAMRKAAANLEKQKQAALDFEFALQDGKLFWLQVRPITSRKLETTVLVWDNTSVEANFPGVTLPLSNSFIQRSFEKAYTGGCKSIGFNNRVLNAQTPLLKNMANTIEGGLFYNVTAWQSILYQMPFGTKLSALLPKLWGMNETPFSPPTVKHTGLDKAMVTAHLLAKLFRGAKYDRQYKSLFGAIVTDFDEKKLGDYALADLIAAYKKLETDLGDNWIAPILNGFYTMVFFQLLKRKVAKSEIGRHYPNFVNDILFAEGEVVSVQLVREFQELLADITADAALKNVFASQAEGEILMALQRDFPPFYGKLMRYISRFGNRTEQGELKMETVSYKQQPELFIRYVKSNLKGYMPRKEAQQKFNYQEVLAEHIPLNFVNRWIYAKLIKSVIKRVKARENYRFMRTDTFAVARTIFLRMGVILAEAGKIESPRDVLYLTLDEVLNQARQSEYKEIIAARKTDYAKFQELTRPNRYIACDDKLYPIYDEHIAIAGDELKGTGCCSGIVTAKVKVIDGDIDFDQDFSDCILIAYYFEPGWISLFYQAKGIISERGNLLSHTAIICRELNVPSIVGVAGLMKSIKNDDEITMNGITGTIKLNAVEQL